MWPDAEDTQELRHKARGGDENTVERPLVRQRKFLRIIDTHMDRLIARRVDASHIIREVLIEASRRRSDSLDETS